MSTLLNYNLQNLPLGLSPSQVRDTVDGLLTGVGYQRVYKTIAPSSGSTPYVGAVTSGSLVDLFDGFDIDNGHHPTIASNGSVGVHLDNPITVSRVVIYRGMAGIGYQLTSFVIEASNDGITWTPFGTYSGLVRWQAHEAREFTVTGSPGAYNYWRVRATGTDVGNHDWECRQVRFYTASGDFVSSSMMSFFLPPASESVGNARGRGVLAVLYSGTAIQFIPMLEHLVPLPATVVLLSKAAGAGNVLNSITLDGVTLSITGVTGASEITNLRSLYEAIRSSSDPAFTAFTWVWQPPAAQNANDASAMILGVRALADAFPSVVGTNIDTFVANGGPAGIRTGQSNMVYPASVTIDLISGCSLFYQISNRAVTFAVRTNTAYYGATHAAWADHAKALASMPSTLDARWLTPIELLVGMDGGQGITDSWATPSHCWGLAVQQPKLTDFSGQLGYGGHPLYATAFRGYWMDGTPIGHAGTTYQVQLPLRGSALFVGADGAGNDFQIHSEKMTAIFSNYVSFSTSGVPGEAVVPILDVPDWYKFVGTASNETLTLVSDVAPVTTLAQDMDNITSYTSVDLTDASAMPAQGTFIVEGEAIYYGAKTGNTATTTLRAQAGSPKQSHWIGDKVYQGLFFTAINGSALFAGTTEPS